MLPAILFTTAFSVSIFIQSLNSRLVGWWLLLYCFGAAVSFYHGNYRYPKNSTWALCVAWIVLLGLLTFILNPVQNGAICFWLLLGMPLLAISARREHLPRLIKCFFWVIFVYAINLIIQMKMHVFYNIYGTPGRYGWPVIDPNNAAAVINIALIPTFHRALRRPICFFVVAVFALALVAAGSKAGGAVAILFCGVLTIQRFGLPALFVFVNAGLGTLAFLFLWHPGTLLDVVESFTSRFPIWAASWPLVWHAPWTGLGMGTYASYYAQVRTETYTAGWHSHNDLLQFAIELGIPAMVLFAALIASVVLTTGGKNEISLCVILAVFLQAMVEFQFYIPAVSFPLGLALAYHMAYAPARRHYLAPTPVVRDIRRFP